MAALVRSEVRAARAAQATRPAAVTAAQVVAESPVPVVVGSAEPAVANSAEPVVVALLALQLAAAGLLAARA